MGLLFSIILGAVAGWLAGQIMKGSGYGPVANIVIGMVGGFIGSFVFGLLGLAAVGLIGRLIMSVVGAIILIYVVRQIKS